ncbi:thiamine pyrophosphokinase [Selenomonas sp. GACV-9]|uniref:thiamine diphosphokinase n=1 Tax=Selenomonas sp. GACV-9 TaxID=3158782 RepID=UPI0008E2F316|nr:thiamine pyrophosphokinase [Selenomonas ruminantium]
MPQTSFFSLTFPQLTAKYAASMPAAPWLLVTGGRPPQSGWLAGLTGFAHCWAADHGIDSCHKNGLVPDCLLGDGDSASTAAWQWAETAGIPIRKFPAAKDLTDTQLALTMMREAGAPFIVLTGAFGGRFDHAFSTIFSAAVHEVPCCLIDESEALFYVTPQRPLTLTYQLRPKAISLLPFTAACEGVTINNVRWPLTGATLTQSQPNAVSNELLTNQDEFTVSLTQGILGVYCYWGKY